MLYLDVEKYINEIPKFTKKNSMDHTKRFMELLGNPDKKMKMIHVAGTNGKGSTCAYINAMLCASGYKVGLFTSPHLEQMTERIRIENQELTRDGFVQIYQKVMNAVAQLNAEGLPHPTFFEFLFGMAMAAFAEAEVEYAILETGLGGRLDATNCIEEPVVTIVTSIGLDHEAYLGDTIEAIAWEKAGIMKPRVPVIYDGSNELVSRIIEERARALDAPCRKIADCAYEIKEINEKDIAFYLSDVYDKHTMWKIKNRGRFQVKNAILAIEAMHLMVGEACNYDVWNEALYHTNWAGRMEEIGDGIFVDGAHNVAAIEAITEDIDALDVVLFAAVSDKNYEDMIQILIENITVEAFVITDIEDVRGVSAYELAAIFKRHTAKPVYVRTHLEEAWEMAISLKKQKGKMLCIGSLYLVGMIKKLQVKE